LSGNFLYVTRPYIPIGKYIKLEQSYRILLGGKQVVEVIPFRPTDKALAIVADYMKENKVKSRSQAVNEILQQHKQPMPEEYTGQLIDCPMRFVMFCDNCPFDFGEYMHVKAPVDSSVCKTCPKYPCESWEWLTRNRVR